MVLDYPDWQASANQQSGVLASLTGFTLTTALQSLVTVQVGNWQYAAIVVTSLPGNSAELVVTQLDSNGIQIGIQNYLIRSLFLQSYVILVPALGSQIAVSGQRAAGNSTSIALEVLGTNIPRTFTNLSTTLLVNTASGSLAQNASFTAALGNYFGYATVWASSTQTSFAVRIRGSDLSGTVVTRTLFAQPSLAENSQTGIWIPPYLNDITVTNLNAANAVISVTVTAELFSGHA